MASNSPFRFLCLIGAALCALAVAACGASDAPQGPAPNLVFIIADDQNFRDFGFMGSPIALTPNIDRLAREGMLFPNGYTTGSLCRPSLRTLLTGLEPVQYAARERALWAEFRESGTEATPDAMIERYETLPRILARHGWASFQSGKHWEGSYRAAGFSEGMTVDDMDQGTRIVRETMQPVSDFIDRHADSPFFLWFAPMLPHWPHDAPERFVDLYADAPLRKVQRRYYANVSRLDSGVGELLDQLDARGLRERTLVVFLVDNGWQALPQVGFRDGPKGKGSLHDPGWRTPIVLRWPGQIPPGTNDALVSTLDLIPSVLDYLDIPVPPGPPGHSLRRLIEGRVDAVRNAVFGFVPILHPKGPDGRELPPGDTTLSGAFIRTDRWYSIVHSDGSQLLYEIEADPEQERDVSAQHPQLTRRLRRRVDQWMERMQQPVEAM